MYTANTNFFLIQYSKSYCQYHSLSQIFDLPILCILYLIAVLFVPQINHLGHFLLCLELLPFMTSTEGDKRIVLVSSMMHSSGVWDPNNLQGNVSYGRIRFYGNSKLYNVSSSWLYSIVQTLLQVMTMYALQRRAKDCGITVSSLHPGVVSINVII